jgi:hypothetical protein
MSTVVPFPLQLERTVFTRLIALAIPEHQPPEADLGGRMIIDPPQNTLNVAKDPQRPNAYVVTARTIVNPNRSAKSPYYIDVECIALLIADGTLSEAEAARGALITGHNVAYGAIREAVAWITGRQPYGPLVLGLSVLNPQQSISSQAPAQAALQADSAGGQDGG